jgi:methylmalonyl-CoA/ethylmalonyl-CoA epimerase
MEIDHIGIATNGIEETAAVYREALGLSVSKPKSREPKVRVAMLPIGESRIELLEATSTIRLSSSFWLSAGPGVHHIAFNVADIRAALRLKSREPG